MSTVQTDQTLKSWCECAEAMGPEASASLIAEVEQAARAMRASADIASDAMPHVFIAVSRNGIAPKRAAWQAVRSLMRRDAARDAGEDVVSLDALADWQRDALQVASESARDSVARSYGGGKRAKRRALAEALEIAPPAARAIVSGVLAEAMARMAIVDIARLPYVALKVSVIAQICGMARPHDKVDSDLMRMAAARAYGMVEALRMGDDSDSEQAHTLARDSFAWLTGERRAYGGNGQCVWQYDARPANRDYAAYRPTKDFVPDLRTTGNNGAALTLSGFKRATGKRAKTGSKIRDGAACGQPAMGVRHGGAGGAYVPANRDTSATLAAARANRALESEALAQAVSESREHGAICQRVSASAGAYPLAPRHGEAASQCACNCGAGADLQITLVAPASAPARYVLTHMLPVCESPESGVCRCQRRAGVLTADGRHKRRAARGAASMV